MGPKSPKTPRTPKRSTKPFSQLTDDSSKVKKNTKRRSSDNTKHKLVRTPTKSLRTTQVSMTDSTTWSPANTADVAMLDETLAGDSIVEIRGQDVFLDAIRPEPGITIEQEINDNARDLRGLTFASEVKIDEQQRLQFVRRIHVTYDGDPEYKLTRTLKAFLDTGSLYSLMFESSMKALEIQYVPCKEEKILYSVEGRPFRVLGQRQILFMYRQMTDKHAADIYVLEDPPGMLPNFDILLGREHLIPAKAVRADYSVIGPTFHVGTEARALL